MRPSRGRRATAYGLGIGAFGATLVMLGGCVGGSSSEESPPTARPPHPAPTAAADCNDLGARRADGYVLAGTDWSDERHAYDEAATVYACVAPGTGGTVALEASGHGITVTPPSRAASSSKTGVLEFRVQARPGATGSLTMRQQSSGGQSGARGPAVVSGSDGWHLAPQG